MVAAVVAVAVFLLSGRDSKDEQIDEGADSRVVVGDRQAEGGAQNRKAASASARKVRRDADEDEEGGGLPGRMQRRCRARRRRS